MKIAFVNQPGGSVVPPVQDGSIEIWTYEVARRLARSGDVIFYAKRGRFQKKVQHYEGVHYRRVSVAVDHWLIRLLKRFSGFRNVRRPLFSSGLYYLGYILQVANNLRRHKCDIVHVHNYAQFVPVIRAFNPKIKIVLHMHCEWLTQLDRGMIERRLGKADLVIGCSEYITETIRRSFPQFASRCQPIFQGVDVNQFVGKSGDRATKGKDAKRLLFVGRVSPEKGLHVLLQAFEKVLERYPQVQLEIVGPKRQLPLEYLVALSDDDKVSGLASFYDGRSRRSYFYHLQRRLTPNLASHVTFCGSVPYANVINHYRDADILVNPSLSESFGRSLIEAMACQMPVIATRVGGMVEIVEDGKTGLLVAPGDATALAEAILRILSDEGLRNSMGQAGRQRVLQCFSWGRIAESLLRLYKHTLRE